MHGKPTWILSQKVLAERGWVAIDPDLEAMNNQHAVLPIGDKTRVVTWGDDPDFPGRRTIVRAQSFPDFKNLHSNKRKTIVTKDKDGKSVTTKIPMGAWWLKSAATSAIRRRPSVYAAA